tara:strand:+ start:162 stop:518 length:357 start_codon:yes stop_codon:yes gene_type:complete
MNRLQFLKRAGLISAAATLTGVSANYLTKNIKENKDIAYVELPNMPGTRFVFGDENDYLINSNGTKEYCVGNTEVKLEEVEKYWGKNLYLKQPDGSFIEYDRQIGAMISNADINKLNK